MKKYLAIILAVCMALSLAACSGSKDGNDNGTAQSQDGGNAQVDNSGKDSDKGTNKDSGGNAGEEVTLNFLIMPDIEALQPTIDQFEELNPGVKINVESLPFDNMFEAIEVRLGAQEESVDMLLVDAPVVANYTAKGFLADLNEFVSDESKGRITESSLGAGTIGGELMALPLYSSCVNLYYNKAIFDEKGIPYPENDVDKRMTWELRADQPSLSAASAGTESGSRQVCERRRYDHHRLHQQP